MSKNCPYCGALVADNAQGCNACHRRFAPPPVAPASASAKKTTRQLVCDKLDIEHNMGYAFISYFSILWLVPLFFAKHSRFARYHCNQGLLVTLFSVAASIVVGIVNGIGTFIGWLIGEVLGGALSWEIISIIRGVISFGGGLFGFIGSAAVIALIVLGLINVFKGRCRPLPVIGKIVIVKY